MISPGISNVIAHEDCFDVAVLTRNITVVVPYWCCDVDVLTEDITVVPLLMLWCGCSHQGYYCCTLTDAVTWMFSSGILLLYPYWCCDVDVLIRDITVVPLLMLWCGCSHQGYYCCTLTDAVMRMFSSGILLLYPYWCCDADVLIRDITVVPLLMLWCGCSHQGYYCCTLTDAVMWMFSPRILLLYPYWCCVVDVLIRDITVVPLLMLWRRCSHRGYYCHCTLRLLWCGCSHQGYYSCCALLMLWRGRSLQGAHWKEAQKILKLAVTRSSTLAAPPPQSSTVSSAAELGAMFPHTSFAETDCISRMHKELPGRLVNRLFLPLLPSSSPPVCAPVHMCLHTLNTGIRARTHTHTRKSQAHAYIYASIHTHTHTNMHTNTHTVTSAHMDAHTRTHTLECICALHMLTHFHACIHIHTCSRACWHAHTHTHTHMHTHIHTHMHTHMHACMHAHIYTRWLTHILAHTCMQACTHACRCW